MDYMTEILRQFAASLMVPVFVVLFILIVFVLWAIGSVVVEYFTERRHFSEALPKAINALDEASFNQVDDVICRTGLLWPQKAALLIVANNAGLPEDALFSLAKGEVAKAERRYEKIVGRTDLLTKIAPMVGLMCTLIPLGPGIVAMGQGQMDILSGSLGVAFDGTVAGLVAAVVAMCVSYIRKRWYNRYSVALEALMATLLEKCENARKAGEKLPTDFTEEELEPLRARAKEYALEAAGKASEPKAHVEAAAGKAAAPARAHAEKTAKAHAEKDGATDAAPRRKHGKADGSEKE